MTLMIFDTETIPDELVLILFNAYMFDHESVFITARNIPKLLHDNPSPNNTGSTTNATKVPTRCTVLMSSVIIKDIERRICHALGVIDGMNAPQSSETLFRSAMTQCRPETIVVGHKNTILMQPQRELVIVVAITCPHRKPFACGNRNIVFIDTLALCNWLISREAQ